MIIVAYSLINNFLLDIFSSLFIFLFENRFDLIFLIYLVLLIVFIVLIIASFYDLKYCEIPNNLSLFLILFGLIFNFALSLFFNDVKFISSSIILGSLIFLLSYIMWNFGFWGGGDVKIFVGLATSTSFLLFFGVLPIFSINISFIPFVFLVIINGILISFPIILFILFKNYFKLNKSNLVSVYNNHVSKKNQGDCVLSKYNKFTLNLSVCWNYFYFFIPFFIFNFFNIVSDGSKKKVNINNLKEGMVLDKSYLNDEYFSEKLILLDSNFLEVFNEINESLNILNDLNLSSKIFSLIYLNNLDTINFEDFKVFNENYYNIEFYFNEPDSNYFFKSSTVGGLTKDDINLIKRLYKNDLTYDYFIVKESIPFLPFILCSFIIVSLWGGFFE